MEQDLPGSRFSGSTLATERGRRVLPTNQHSSVMDQHLQPNGFAKGGHEKARGAPSWRCSSRSSRKKKIPASVFRRGVPFRPSGDQLPPDPHRPTVPAR